MNTKEVGDLLAFMALYDNRKVGPGDIMAWEDILPTDMTFTDAREALRGIRMRSADWIMPAHIINEVREVRKLRLTRAGTPPMPGDLTWAQEKSWRALWCAHVKDGMSPPDAALAASDAMNLPRDPEIEVRADRVRQIAAFSHTLRSMPTTDQQHPADTQAGRA